MKIFLLTLLPSLGFVACKSFEKPKNSLSSDDTQMKVAFANQSMNNNLGAFDIWVSAPLPQGLNYSEVETFYCQSDLQETTKPQKKCSPTGTTDFMNIPFEGVSSSNSELLFFKSKGLKISSTSKFVVFSRQKGSATLIEQLNIEFKNSETPDTHGFLTADELAPPKESQSLAEKNIRLDIDYNRNHFSQNHNYKNDPSSRLLPPNKFSESLLYEVQNDTATLDIENRSLEDTLDSEIKFNKSREYTSVYKKLKTVFICEGTDLSKFNGIAAYKVHEARKNLQFECPKSIKNFSQEYTEVTYTDTQDGVSTKIQEKRYRTMSTKDLQPCNVDIKGETHEYSNCVFIVKTTRVSLSAKDPRKLGQNTFSRFEFENLKGKKDSEFYFSGKINFQIDNWKGSMTYNDLETPAWTTTLPQALSGLLGETIVK